MLCVVCLLLVRCSLYVVVVFLRVACCICCWLRVVCWRSVFGVWCVLFVAGCSLLVVVG